MDFTAFQMICMLREVLYMSTKPLIRYYTDEQGNDMVEVSAWYFDELIRLLEDEPNDDSNN